MAPTKDYIKVKVTGDSDAVTSNLFVENTIENPAWYTVEDNHVSLVSENVENVFKLETAMLDDCMWESRIEITKDVSNQNNVELPLESQDVADNNIYLNHGNTSDKIFHCNICGKSFVLNYLLKNHMAEHKRQVNRNTNKCKFCGKQFKLKFGLNRHIQKHHNPMHKSKYRSKFTEHKNSHEKNQTNFDTIPNIKLCKLNGVWKSKTNEFKCNICFQKCYSEKNLVEHMETHDNSQTQCNYCLDYVSVSELNNHMENIHNEHLFKCQKCNQQFKKQRHLNCHLIHCLRSSHTKSNKVCSEFKANEKTCSACGITFNSSLSLTNHTTIGCKHYTCKYCGQYFSKRHFWLKHMDIHKKVKQCSMLKVSTDETSTIEEYNQTEVVNDSSFNTNGGQLLSRDVTGRNSSDHTSLVNSNSTVVSAASHTYIPNNEIISNPEPTETLSNSLETNSSNLLDESTILSVPPITPPVPPIPVINIDYLTFGDIVEPTQLVNCENFPTPVPLHEFQNNLLNMKQEKFFYNTVRDHFQHQLNIRQSQINRQQSINSRNSIANNESQIIDVQYLSRALRGINSFDYTNLANRNESIVSAASHNSMTNNNSPVINIKQETNLSTTLRGTNSSDQTNLANRNESIVSAASHNSMANNNSTVINIKQEKNLCSNLRERNSSDQVDLVNSNESIVSAASHNSMTNNNSPVINIKQEKNLSTTLRERNSSDQVDLVNSNESIVSAASYNSMTNNNSPVINIKQEKNLSTTLRGTNSSDQVDLVNSNESIVSAASHNSIANSNSPVINIKQEKNLCTNARERNSSDQVDLVNSNESIVSAASHNSMTNNNSPVINIKQEKNLSTTLRGANSSDQTNLANRNESIVSAASHNSIANSNSPVINIKQEKSLCTNARERNSSDQVDSVNSNESTLVNEPQDLVAKQNPTNIANNNIASTVRETPYFCIRKLPIIKNVVCNNDYEQASQNNVIFICRICKNSPSTDIHSFALHMSDHSECNMHECIVCDKTFNSVVLWTDHMTYHQQQIDFNVSTVQFNPQETESNTLEDPINSENIEPQVCTNLRNRKLKLSLIDDSDTTSLKSAKKIKCQHDCSTCKKVFPSKSSLQIHLTLHNKPQSFSCRYCNKIFSGKGPCTNHEKSHIPDKQLLQNNENIILEPILIQNSISIQDNNTDFETMSIKHTKINKSSSIKKTNFCNLCNRKFTKRCYFTNHMMIKHNLNPNTPKQHPSIDSNEPIIQSENIELISEYKNKSSVPVNNNLNNHVNKINEKKSTVCMSCNKHFAHLGALTNHMRVHYYKPYKCQYCFMQFSKKRPYIMHEKKHELKNVVNSATSQNKNNIVIEVNDEPQIEHCNDFESVHTQVDDNSSGTNCMDIEHLWFSCDVCEEKFSTPLQLNVHRNSHSGIVPFVCKICNRSFQLKFRWNWHLKVHYKKPNSKSKQETNNLKSSISKLKVESIYHTDKMKCRYCKKEYNSISQWKKHMTMSKECRRHCKSNLPEFTSNKTTKNSSKSVRYRCNICEKTYSTTSNRNLHQKNVHNVLDTSDLNTSDDTILQKDKPMDIIQQKPAIKKRNRSNHSNGTKCGLCGKIYSNVGNLSRHISIIHAQTLEPITCNVCGSTFKHKFSYKEHLKTKHKQLFKHYVETNPTNKRTSRQIMEVNKINTMKYFCKICKMKFADNITLQEHSKVHSLNMYMCKDCGQQFETNVTLGKHILENHKANISSSSMNEDVETYESQNASPELIDYKRVQCKICLKVLKTPKYLRLHMRLHTGVKPFKCDKCNQAFRFNSNFRVHQKKNSCCIP